MTEEKRKKSEFFILKLYLPENDLYKSLIFNKRNNFINI